MLEFLLEVVARFVGVSVVALFKWCRCGFRKSYRSIWAEVFDKNSEAYSWIDIFGVVVIFAVIAAVVLVVLVLTDTLNVPVPE